MENKLLLYPRMQLLFVLETHIGKHIGKELSIICDGLCGYAVFTVESSLGVVHRKIQHFGATWLILKDLLPKQPFVEVYYEPTPDKDVLTVPRCSGGS